MPTSINSGMVVNNSANFSFCMCKHTRPNALINSGSELSSSATRLTAPLRLCDRLERRKMKMWHSLLCWIHSLEVPPLLWARLSPAEDYKNKDPQRAFFLYRNEFQGAPDSANMVPTNHELNWASVKTRRSYHLWKAFSMCLYPRCPCESRC